MVGVGGTFGLAAAVLPVAAAAASAASTSSAVLSLPFRPSPAHFRRPSPAHFRPFRRRSCALITMATLQVAAPPSVTDSQDATSALPELLTEFMVDMKCDGCVTAVKSKLQSVAGIRAVEVDLENQVVRVLSSVPIKSMLDALLQTGRNARLIGQGNPNEFLVSAAVAEFKGPDIFGVVRFAQINMELVRIEASFSGLSPGSHSWAINEFGNLTRGAASTGKVYNPLGSESEKPLGDLGTLEASENGDAIFSGSKENIKVADLIGRSVALWETEDRSNPGIAAAVIARSAGVGENYKKLCTCDGVTIWESS